MIDSHKAHNERKIQLIMRINFVSFIDNNDHCIIHTKSENIEIMSGIETNDIINDLFKSFLKRYQENLETKMKGSSFIFESVDLLYYSHKISHSPDWIKLKKATINPKNDNNECFKYGIIAALNHERLEKTRKEYQKLNHLSIIIIRRTLSFHHTRKTGKNLNKIIRQLLLTFYLYHLTLKK